MKNSKPELTAVASAVERSMRGTTTPQDLVHEARAEETSGTRLRRTLLGAVEKVTDWLRPSPPGDLPVTAQMSRALTERVAFHDWLTYRQFDDERQLVYINSADTFRAGFVLGFAPLLVAGTDVEPQLEAVITNCPADTVMQFGVLSGGQTAGILSAWLHARLVQNPHPMLMEIAMRRAEYFEAASGHEGTLVFGGTTLQPRNYFYYVSVTLPFHGDPGDEQAMALFLKGVEELRATMEGSLKGASIPSAALDRRRFEFLVTELLNPHLTPAERREWLEDNNMAMPAKFISRDTRITMRSDGGIHFRRGKTEEQSLEEYNRSGIVASVLTMDAPPPEGWLPNTSKLLGHPLARDDRISCPFWLHTTLHIQHPDRAKDRLTTKLGALNKQVMSESPWYRSMMGHMYIQKDELDGILDSARHGHAPVRVWTGVVLYNSPEKVKRETEYVANLWRKATFRCSPERFIALPVFLASMPLMYDPESDPPGRGLQRANTVSSFNAATLLHVQGDWRGSEAERGGPLLISRRGQLATVDLFASSTNYNFVVVAQSGSGKSFLSNELAVDFLSRNGVVRIFDVGRSYKRFASVMNGSILEFSPDNPKSLNPFHGINTHADLYELMPVLKSLIRQMAFPLSDDESMETQFNWEYQAIEIAITSAWEQYREITGLEHVYHWMAEQEDDRFRNLAFQLHSFAVGRYAAWFNGPRQVELDNDLIIVELEDLEVDPDLQAVVMTLMIHQITKDMYLSDPERKRPKLLLVDEGWRLLGDKQSGGFISKAFRTVRKYRGSAGAITQSFADFAASAAARAALENATWQFVLKQKGESVDFAVNQKWLTDDPQLVGMLKSVNSDQRAGFSEVFVRGENGQGVYRFVTDRHSYWLYTTNGEDLARLAKLQQEQGLTLLDAVDHLAREDYARLRHPMRPYEGSLLERWRQEQAEAEAMPA